MEILWLPSPVALCALNLKGTPQVQGFWRGLLWSDYRLSISTPTYRTFHHWNTSVWAGESANVNSMTLKDILCHVHWLDGLDLTFVSCKRNLGHARPADGTLSIRFVLGMLPPRFFRDIVLLGLCWPPMFAVVVQQFYTAADSSARISPRILRPVLRPILQPIKQPIMSGFLGVNTFNCQNLQIETHQLHNCHTATSLGYQIPRTNLTRISSIKAVATTAEFFLSNGTLWLLQRHLPDRVPLST